MTYRIKYNSPIVLSFSLLCTAVFLIIGGFTNNEIGLIGSIFYMPASGVLSSDPLDYLRLFSHSMGHSSWGHLIRNLAFILVVGPILEEKYGSLQLLGMMFMTALVTGLFHVVFTNSWAIGASGIVFMMIILSSFGSFERKEIPLTFILVMVIYLGGELIDAFSDDNISQTGHIIGGLCGAVFGFLIQKNTRRA